MFQIGEEDFSFGDDEDFWSEALEVEATNSASTSSKSVSKNHALQNHQGGPATDNAQASRGSGPSMQMLGCPGSVVSAGSVLKGSREVNGYRTLQDSNRGLPPPTSPSNQAKRKFSFKQKSPRDGSGPCLSSATAGAVVSTINRAKQDNQTPSPFISTHLTIGGERFEGSQDLSKNVEVSLSKGNLGAPTNQMSGVLTIKHPLSYAVGKTDSLGQQRKGQVIQSPQGGPANLPGRTGESTFRVGPDKGSGLTPVRTSPNLSDPSKQPSNAARQAAEGLPFEVGCSFEEDINLSEEDFCWDPVTTPSLTATNVTQSVATLRPCHQLNPVGGHRPSSTLRDNGTVPKPNSVSTTPGVDSTCVPGCSTSKPSTKGFGSHPPGTLDQRKSNVTQGGPSMSKGPISNSASYSPPSCEVGSGSPGFSSSKPGQLPSNFSPTQNHHVQGNPSRMSFQPRAPSPRYLTPRPGPQCPQRGNTPMRASTPGYTSPPPCTQDRGRLQGASSTPKTLNGQPLNSTPRRFATPAQRFNNSANQVRHGTTQGDRPFTTHGATTQNRGTATPQTPLLTSRVAKLFQTPTAGSNGPTRTRVRKFPGPAGVLPKLMQGQKLNDVKLPSPEADQDTSGTSSNKPEEFVSSQDVGDVDFSHGAWQTMKTDLGLEEDSPHSILSKNNIALVLRKASLKQLTKNKVPHLCVLIKAVTFSGDASVVLRDPTGEMQGTMPRRLVEEHQGDLRPGSVLVLRQVGVLSPTLRNHYLNITPSNVVQIYPSESCSLSQSTSQKTPNSRTLRHTRRPSQETPHLLDAELNSPRKPGSSPPSRKSSRDAQDKAGTKRSESLEYRPESSGLQRDDPLRNAPPREDRELHETLSGGCQHPKPKRHPIGSRNSLKDEETDTVKVPNQSHVHLDEETTHTNAYRGASNKRARLDEEATPSNRPNVRQGTHNSNSVINRVGSSEANDTLDSRESHSSKDFAEKGEDYTELLADLDDEFFDDF